MKRLREWGSRHVRLLACLLAGLAGCACVAWPSWPPSTSRPTPAVGAPAGRAAERVSRFKPFHRWPTPTPSATADLEPTAGRSSPEPYEGPSY